MWPLHGRDFLCWRECVAGDKPVVHAVYIHGVTVPTAQTRNLRPRTQEAAHSHRLINQGTEANRGRNLDKLRRAPMVGCEF